MCGRMGLCAAQKMFDIIFCYFPISFRPPPDDPYGITPEDLKLALRCVSLVRITPRLTYSQTITFPPRRDCMASTPAFAPMATPIFLEKLPPSLGTSKRDVLQSLTACIPVYGSRGVQPFVGDLWDGLKTEVSFQLRRTDIVPADIRWSNSQIFYSPDADIEQDALITFTAMIATLYPNQSDLLSADLVMDIIKECQDQLAEAEKSKAKPAVKVVVACFKASRESVVNETQACQRLDLLH